MSVKFRDPLSAQACVLVSPSLNLPIQLRLIGRQQKMNGRFFAGQKVEAFLYSGKQRFKRSGAGEDLEEDGDERKRLDDFAQWLMAEGD